MPFGNGMKISTGQESRLQHGQRLLRTLRRVRHDINMLRRAAREAGDDAVHECAAAPWQLAADSAATTLRTTGEVLAGKRLPEGPTR